MIRCRPALPSDAAAVTEVYRRSGTRLRFDSAETDASRLAARLDSGALQAWLAETDAGPAAALTALEDSRHRLVKILSLGVDRGRCGFREAVRALLEAAKKGQGPEPPEVLYTTTRCFSLEEQSVTLDAGFHLLGTFPNAPGADRSRVNGLTGWFASEALSRRAAGFALHPALARLYEAVRRETGLAPLPIGAVPEPPAADAPPALELVAAPRLAAARLRRLRERPSGLQFYPFQEPTVLITDSEQRIEAFARLVPEMGFAIVIGERLDAHVNPVEFYRETTRLLEGAGAAYIEVLNDAADLNATDCMLRAGFAPCAYFPALQRRGGARRDQVVFSWSREPFGRSGHPIPKEYAPFVDAYLEASGRSR